MKTVVSLTDQLEQDEVVNLYRANKWSAADRPDLLLDALKNSHSLVTARDAGKLVGLGNAISDGYLVVYFPHMLVLPTHQRQGVGRKMMQVLLDRYANFHQLMLTADRAAIAFYQSMGFVRAGRTEHMWIYAGTEH